jgi:hypothetical protein
MATAVHMFSNNDRQDSSGSDDQTSSTQTRRSVSTNNQAPRPGQHLDGLSYIFFEKQIINYELI